MNRIAIHGNPQDVEEILACADRLYDSEFDRISDIHELEDGGFQGVLFCSRDTPIEQLRYAAQLGKHILCPPVVTRQNAESLIEDCRQSGARLMFRFTDRFLPSVQIIKRNLDAGHLGEPGLLRIHRWGPNGGSSDEAMADIDLAVWLFQSIPTHVFAVQRSVLPTRMNYLQIHLGFTDGEMGLIDRSSAVSTANGYFSLSLIGSSGAAYSDDHHNQQLLFRGEQAVALRTREDEAAHLAQLRDFVAAVSEDRESTESWKQYWNVLKVHEAVATSADRGEALCLTGDAYE